MLKRIKLVVLGGMALNKKEFAKKLKTLDFQKLSKEDIDAIIKKIKSEKQDN